MANEMNIYFVLPSHCDDELSTSEEMQQAFELCRQNQIIPEWLSETNCMEKNFDKKDIVVFEKFEGETFKNFKTRLRVVGPWCIITCLLEGLQVPSNKSPIYNMAMYKLVVTASNYTAEEKKKMKEKVEMMGGVFILNIINSTTHLITNSVRTQKYAVANQKEISVMLDSWVEDVWNCSITRNVKATDVEFQKHKCPCFQNLRMCSTGFEVVERSKLQKLIADNGGKYSGKLLTVSTDLLVCKPGTKSEKYEVARKAKIPCVRMEWIYDSIEKGYAQPEEDYIIKVASSTPTKGGAPLNPDFSMMSIIAGNENTEPHKSSVSDSINVSLYNLTTQNRKEKEPKQKENQMPDIVGELDLQSVKKAGTFLDGCGVLLVGFSPQRREKFNRVLRSAGATRYDAPSDRVTQVIVDDPNCHEARLISGRAPLVSPSWLLESMRRGQPVPEEPFIIHTGVQVTAAPTPSSPLSKKGLTLLQNDSMVEPELSKQSEPEPEHESIKLYKMNKIEEEDTLAQLIAQGNINSKFETKSVNPPINDTTEQEEIWNFIFQDKIFKLIDHSEEEIEIITSRVEDLGGKVVGKSYRGITDYVVLPPISGSVQHAAEEIVNSIWILECHASGKLLPLLYYHQPLIIANNSEPLEDCVISISGYVSFERTFLIKLIQSLGAVYQEKFARVTQENSNVLGCTHLVCFEASGSKWTAAQRWKKYAVTHVWLLKCAETGQKVSENQYLRTDDNQDSEIMVNTPDIIIRKEESKRKSPPPSTSKLKYEKLPPLRTPDTSAMSNKRDHEGRRISPSTETLNTSLLSSKRDLEGKKNLPLNLQTDKIEQCVTEDDKSDELLITLDDGQRIPFSKFMDELQKEGIFDTPSPVPREGNGTPLQEILARLRREGKIPSNTPTKNTSELGAASQGTPVGRYLRALQERNVLPASPKQTDSPSTDSPIPRNMFDIKTPETPLGRFLGEDNPSRSTRKQWQKYLERMPHYPIRDSPAVPPRRPSTPWLEVKRQAWAYLIRNKDSNDSMTEPSQPPEPEHVTETQQEVSNQIGQLQELIKKRESISTNRSVRLGGAGVSSTSSGPAPSDAKDSQTDAVGWDKELENCVFSETTGIAGPRKFMMSSVEQSERTNICNIICSLGGEVSKLNCFDSTATHVVCPNPSRNICNIICSLGGEVSKLNCFDSTATHVVCPNPSRNEKILSSMAAGLWILHLSYIEKSGAAGRFLPEEEYELGNPKSLHNIQIETTPVIEAIHWWRVKVRETGKGAFNEMRALLFTKNNDAVVRLVEAGGGTVVQASPPFTDRIDVTHCFIDPKLKLDLNEFIPLAAQGVPCLNILYLSNFLCSRTNVNINEFMMPELNRYYN